MSQSEKSFTVSDRRHFTAEGRPRDEEQPATAREPPPGGETGKPARASSKSAAEDRPAEFSHFLSGLAAEAGRLLSREAVPEETPREETLAAARSIVAILEMLKDKTEGRRTAEEDTLFAGLLFELRMAYVERTRAGQL